MEDPRLGQYSCKKARSRVVSVAHLKLQQLCGAIRHLRLVPVLFSILSYKHGLPARLYITASRIRCRLVLHNTRMRYLSSENLTDCHNVALSFCGRLTTDITGSDRLSQNTCHIGVHTPRTHLTGYSITMLLL